MTPVDVPREHAPLADGPDALGDRPSAGRWLVGLRSPLTLWWRCPTCDGQIPLYPAEVGADGVTELPVLHSRRCLSEEPTCSWDRHLRLLDYDRDEVDRATRRAAEQPPPTTDRERRR